MSIRRKWLAAPLLTFIATTASAAITVYTDPVAYFEVAKTPTDVITFQGSPPGGSFAAPTSYSEAAEISGCGKPGGGCGAPLRWINNSVEYRVLGTMYSDIEIRKAINPGTESLEYDNFIAVEIYGHTESAYFTVYHSDGILPETVYLNGRTGFFGIVGNQIWSLQIGKAADGAFGQPNLDYELPFYVDTVFVSIVPEPAASLLILVGLAPLAGWARRRQRRHRRANDSAPRRSLAPAAGRSAIRA